MTRYNHFFRPSFKNTIARIGANGGRSTSTSLHTEFPMIGLVLVTHGRLADEFGAALEHVMGPQKQIEAITIGAEDDPELCRSDIIEAVNRVDSGDGVAILTDMFGGTPSNLAISCMSRPNVEVLAGINLPCWSSSPRCARNMPCRRLSPWLRRPVANTSLSPAGYSPAKANRARLLKALRRTGKAAYAG